MSHPSTFSFSFSFPAPHPQPSPFRRTGAIFTFTPEAAVGSKRHAVSALLRSTKRRKIGVLKRSKSNRASAHSTSANLASAPAPTIITSTPSAHATMAIRPRSAVTALLQAAMGCSLVTAKADGLEDLREYVNSLSPVKEVFREVKGGLQDGAKGKRLDGMEEVWEWGSRSGFRWSDRELRGCVRAVAILETILEEDEQGGR